MQITAAVISEAGSAFELQPLELEKPRSHELLVKLVGVGVCHTDVIFRYQEIPSPLPAVFGHEGSGIVVAVGDSVTEFSPGDHVVMSYAYCGKCPACLQGMYYRCTQALMANFGCCRLDGSSPLAGAKGRVHGNFFGQSSFATYTVAEERTVVKVAKDAPLEILGPLGCGIQTGSGAVINTLAPKAGSSIVIFGCGAVGLSAIMAARLVGCAGIIAVDLNEQRLDLARSFGATTALNPSNTDDVVAAIHQATAGGADYAVECTGNANVLRQAVDAIAAHGVCAVVGASAAGTEVSLDMNSLMLGRTVRGVIEGDAIPKNFIPALIDLNRQGRFPFDRLISTYAFGDINKAFEDVEKGRVVKAVLLFD